MSDSNDVGYAAFGLGFGVWSFFWGFNRLRRKRLIENIPTSTVRGLAMGLVELNGKAQRTKPLRGPFSAEDCVAYRYTVERYQQRDRNSSWETIAKGDSFYCPFWLEDPTGKILVFPQGAELILSLGYEFKNGLGRPLPENLINFMQEHNIRYKAWIFENQLRFREWHIFPNQEVYVLGVAKKDSQAQEGQNLKLIKRLESLKADSQKMAALDTDQDGLVSHLEWDAAVARVEQELISEELQVAPVNEHSDVVIGKGEEEKTFLISDQSQEEITRKFSWQAVLGIWGGAGLTLAALGYLLLRLGFLNRIGG